MCVEVEVGKKAKRGERERKKWAFRILTFLLFEKNDRFESTSSSLHRKTTTTKRTGKAQGGRQGGERRSTFAVTFL